MSLPHAILGLINYVPATGYDVKNTFKRSIHFFWNATLPQIYRTLRQMEADGWVASVVEHQDGKPSRKIYHVTESGQREFAAWLARPPEAPEPRSSNARESLFRKQDQPGAVYHAGDALARVPCRDARTVREGGSPCRHGLFDADGHRRGRALLEVYARFREAARANGGRLVRRGTEGEGTGKERGDESCLSRRFFWD